MTAPKQSAEDVANQIVDFINKEFYKAPVQESGTRWVLLQPGLIEILTQYADEKVQEFVDAINDETECGHKLGWTNVVGEKEYCEVCRARAEALEEAYLLPNFSCDLGHAGGRCHTCGRCKDAQALRSLKGPKA